MYKHILLPVAIDQNVDMRRALAVARALLAPAGKLTLFHAVPPVPVYVQAYMPLDLQQKLRAAGREQLNTLADQYGIESVEIAYDSPGRAIVQWAENNDVDCIVMASHQPVLSDAILGSTAAWVVRHAKTTIHVMR